MLFFSHMSSNSRKIQLMSVGRPGYLLKRLQNLLCKTYVF